MTDGHPRWTDDGYLDLSSGRRLNQPNRHIIGIAPGDPDLYGGYDGVIFEYDLEKDEDAPFTAAERREIADFMKAQWDAWAGMTDGVATHG